MKKIFAYYLALLMCLPLCACRTQNPVDEPSQGSVSNESTGTLPLETHNSANVPSEELILQDITEALLLENKYATLSEVETVKSLTEDGTYEITLAITAETQYAHWSYETNMCYTKYDQGWMVDDVSFVAAEYVLVNIPDAQTFTNHAGNYLSSDEVYSTSAYAGYMIPMENVELVYNEPINNDTILEFRWVGIEHLLHADNHVQFTSLWRYDATTDNWALVPDDSYYGYHLYDESSKITPNRNLDFSGTWPILNTIDDTATISNFSWESFDLRTTQASSTASGHYEIDFDSEEATVFDLFFRNKTGGFLAFRFTDSSTTITFNDGNNNMGVLIIKSSLPDLD